MQKQKQEIENMQKQIQTLEAQRNSLTQTQKILESDKKSYQQRVKNLDEKNDQLNS